MSRRSVIACAGLLALVVVGGVALEKAYGACAYACTALTQIDTGSQCLQFSEAQGYNVYSENPQYGTYQDCSGEDDVNWTEYEFCWPECNQYRDEFPSDASSFAGNVMDSGTTTKCVCTDT